ncbi:MAG: hypothetical protein OXI43_21995 [Candidatus Poribacteria bacterium]|nr:hypothetical protein [Candidatus Poribacteria bacterium]
MLATLRPMSRAKLAPTRRKSVTKLTPMGHFNEQQSPHHHAGEAGNAQRRMRVWHSP